MNNQKRDRFKEREQAVIDRAERIYALRLMRILTADAALSPKPPQTILKFENLKPKDSFADRRPGSV
jgi:hypothetical protein